MAVHPPVVRQRARALVESGLSLRRAGLELGVARDTLRRWRADGWAGGETAVCFRCQVEPSSPPHEAAYAHLLGLYLGDGCISSAARTYSLRIACADAYPRLIDECAASLRCVRAGRVWRVRAPGCTHVASTWNHWPCVFPQHGPGPKHLRTIQLADWQQEVVERHRGPFLRGLLHSDGCRSQNWATRSVDGELRRYTGYARYVFTNTSPDIRRLCCESLDAVGVRHTHPRGPQGKDISVARKADVALLDTFVGRKG